MKRKTMARNALFTSIISLLLCVSMLVGTTFAWFTDSVTSANNVIKSGNLDIELEYWNGTEWIDVAGQSNILTNTLWEPGVTEIAYLRLANAGSLALKYQMGVNIVSETPGVNQAGEGFNLSEHIMFGVAQVEADAQTKAPVTYATRELAVAAVNAEAAEAKAAAISTGYSKSSALYPVSNVPANEVSELYLALVVYMPTTVGNEANHNGVKVPQIDLGINVFATQIEAENDSFGNDYDEGLQPDENGIARILDDGSTVMYYGEDTNFNGRVRLTALPENVGDEYVVPADVNDLGGALVGAHLDKLTIPSGVQYAYKSLEGAVIGEIVIEDGATTVPNRMFYKTNVDTVTIPGTVTVIEQNAFAQTMGLKELVIPASVTTVEEAAFTHADELEKVTFEGNIAIQGYAFRGCDKLSTVIMNGEDVTFIASTLNGRNSTWFCNGESNNPNVSDIDFYVVNDVVAARVKTAMGAEANNTDVYINGEKYYPPKVVEFSGTDIQEALNSLNSGDKLVLPARTYTTTGTFAVPAGVTISGKEGAMVVLHQDSAAQDDIFNCAGDVVIENITFESNRKGYAIAGNTKEHDTNGNIVVRNCKFVGLATEKNWGIYKNLNGNLTVENCSFNNYNNAICGVNNGDGSTTTITGCTFTNINGEAIGYVSASVPADFEATVIANNTGLTAENVVGY